MAAQTCLARRPLRALRLQLRRQFLLHDDIRLDALCLNGPACGRVVAGGRQADCPVRTERNDGLHGTFAEGPGADNGRPLMVLQGTRDDLRGRRRSAIDEHHDRLAIGNIARARIGSLCLLQTADPWSARWSPSPGSRRTRRSPDRATRRDCCAGP